jgi:hypothetical protein
MTNQILRFERDHIWRFDHHNTSTLRLSESYINKELFVLRYYYALLHDRPEDAAQWRNTWIDEGRKGVMLFSVEHLYNGFIEFNIAQNNAM